MAVYERRYRPYVGPETPTRWRFLVPTRYVLSRLFDSKGFLFFLALCCLPTIGFLVYTYIANNLDRLSQLFGAEQAVPPQTLTEFVFMLFFEIHVQGLGMIMTTVVGPRIISPDLVNNALPLYFVRPFGKWEYVAGKVGVIFSLISLITVVPAVLLWLTQSAMSWDWMTSHFDLLLGIIVCGFAAALVYALIAAAISAVIRWRLVAAVMTFAVVTMGPPVALATNMMLRTDSGGLLDVQHMLRMLRHHLIGDSSAINSPLGLFSLPAAAAMLTIVCGACLWILHRKVRAYEVVR
jgi:hypothetical protein